MRINLDLSACAIGLLVFLVAFRLGVASPASGGKLVTVPRSSLCVTEGAIEELPGGRLGVSVPKMRAYLNALTPQSVEADFIYLGSTGNEARLGSGELPAAVRPQAARARCVQPGVCDVAHRAGVETGRFGKEQSRPAQQR